MEKFDWGNKKVLVTGAGGFIGSHLTDRLVELGARVTALIEYNSLGRWDWLEESPFKKDIEVVMGDIRDSESIRKIFRQKEIVFHLAALIGVPYSYEAPLSYVQTNVLGTLNVLQVALENEVERFIHTSTSEIYGMAQYVPMDENHPSKAQSPYAATKIAADMLAESFYRSFNLPLVTVRPFNTYGPRQSARAVIPTIITQVLAGHDVELGAITPTRDMNYVQDTVSGFIAAASAEKKAVGQVFNIGSGSEISIGNLAKLIVDLMGSKVQIMSKTERLRPERSEVYRLKVDYTKASDVLGWRPHISLKEGLQYTIQWFREPRHMAFHKSHHYYR